MSRVPSEDGSCVSNAPPGALAQFYGQLALFKDAIDIVEETINYLNESAYVMKTLTDEDDETELQQGVARKVTSTNGVVVGVKNALQAMKTQITAAEQEAGSEKTAEILIAHNAHLAFSKKFRNVVQRYQDSQVTFKNGVAGKIRRKLMVGEWTGEVSIQWPQISTRRR